MNGKLYLFCFHSECSFAQFFNFLFCCDQCNFPLLYRILEVDGMSRVFEAERIGIGIYTYQ